MVVFRPDPSTRKETVPIPRKKPGHRDSFSFSGRPPGSGEENLSKHAWIN